MPSRSTIGAMAAVSILAAAAAAHYSESLWCRDCLDGLASLVTIFALGVAAPWYLLRMDAGRRGKAAAVSTGLYMEIANARDRLGEGRHGDPRAAGPADGTRARFAGRMLGHCVYDSLIRSGGIFEVRAELQQPVQSVFRLIKDHNYALERAWGLDRASDGGSAAAVHYRSLCRIDSDLQRRIPAVMDALKKECRITGGKGSRA